MIIGIVGSIASGKDTVAEYLETKGFVSISLSDTLRKIMKSEGLEISIPNMTEYGNKLRETKEHGYLAKLALKEMNEDTDAVITSIRQEGEAVTLKSRADFTLVKLDAPIEMRMERLIERAREGDIKNMDELREIEAKQASGENGAMNMNKCFSMANHTLINDGTIDDLHRKVDKMLEDIYGK